MLFLVKKTLENSNVKQKRVNIPLSCPFILSDAPAILRMRIFFIQNADIQSTTSIPKKNCTTFFRYGCISN
jgi:hypothetical protein